MATNERTHAAIEKVNTIYAARVGARTVTAKFVDVTALAHELDAHWAAVVAGQVWTACEPPTDAGELTRDDYLRAVLQGVLAHLARDASSPVFRFKAATVTPDGRQLRPAACHNLVFQAEAGSDPFEPKITVTVFGDRLAVPPGAR